MSETWIHTIDLRARDLDYLGHVTETVHVELIEEARFRLMQTIMANDEPIYVVAAHSLNFRRELRLAEGPVKVTVDVLHIGKRRIETVEQILTASSELRTESNATLVAWDTATRRPRDLTELERERLGSYVGELSPVDESEMRRGEPERPGNVERNVRDLGERNVHD